MYSRRSSHNRPNENNLFSPLTNHSSPNYTDSASALNPGASSLNPGGAPDRSSFLPPLLPLPYFESHQSSWSSNNSQQNYAVPKNQQKNLMSKERDSRRVQGAQVEHFFLVSDSYPNIFPMTDYTDKTRDVLVVAFLK